MLPPANKTQTSLKSLADASPNSFVCAGLQARILADASFDGKGWTEETKLPWAEPCSCSPTPRASATGLRFWTHLRGDWPEKSALKAKKKSQIKVSTVNLSSGLKV